MGVKALAAYNTTKENAAEEPKISDNFLAWISFSKYSKSAGSLRYHMWKLIILHD